MKRHEIAKRIIDTVAVQLGIEDKNKTQITESTRFVEDLRTDSLDNAEMVMRIEEEFDVTISDKEAEKLKTVGQTIDCVFALVNPK